MKKLLMVLLNIIGVASFMFGLLRLGFYEGSTTDYRLLLNWLLYMAVPIIVIAIDLKYFDRIFGLDLHLKR